MNKNTDKDLPIALRAVVKATGGISTAQISARTGWTFARASYLMTLLQRAGKITRVRIGCGSVWCRPDRAADIRSAYVTAKGTRSKRRYAQSKARAAAVLGGVAPVESMPASLRLVVQAASRGATIRQIAAAVGLSLDRTRSLAWEAGKAGLLVKVPQGATVLWAPPSVAESIQARQAKGTKAARSKPTESGWFVQRTGVSASLPLPFKCRAPRSIFDMVPA